MKMIPDRRLWSALHDAFGIEPSDTRRVVIDIEAGHIPVVHVELYADDQTVNVIRELGGVRIERAEKAVPA